MLHPRMRLGVAMAVLITASFTASPTAGAADRHEIEPRSQSVRLTETRLKIDDTLDGPVIDLTIRNDGTVAHELAVVQVARGTTVQQMIDAAMSGTRDPSFVLDDPGGVFFLGAGEQVRYQRSLRPATYIFFVPKVDGSPQLSRAAYRVVRVIDSRQRRLADAERSIDLGDETLTVPRLAPGARRYAITNTGTVAHEVFIIGVADAADLERGDDIGAWLDGGQVGPPPVPVHLPGSHQTIDPGVAVVLTLTLRASTTYAFTDFQTGLQAIAATR